MISTKEVRRCRAPWWAVGVAVLMPLGVPGWAAASPPGGAAQGTTSHTSPPASTNASTSGNASVQQTQGTGASGTAGAGATTAAAAGEAGDEAAFAGELPDPRPLARDVHFWVRVYTEIDTDEGFLHDQYNLAVVYQTLKFAPGTSRRARQRIVSRARDRIADELRQIASGSQPLSAAERRIRSLWGPNPSARTLRDAADNIRFQLGQSNRFKAGLIRSGAWQHAIARALSREGLPPQLAALPLVESSYNPRAYSKDGAAGLWQFMPETGRRFLTIDRAVDERLDPFSATKAAAQLLAYNHRILGTWPLAITAYNHGVAGVRRASEELGTTNIVTIVRHYHTRSFGFASRNFYVSFLAALRVEEHPRRYFGPIHKLPEERFSELTLPGYVAARPLERVLGIDEARLRELNPALRPLVWNGSLDVPRGYRLRLPITDREWTAATLAASLKPGELLASQPVPPSYRVRRGDTLSGIAAQFRMGVRELARYNGIRTGAMLHIGERILLPRRARRAAAGPLLAAVGPHRSAATAAPSSPPQTEAGPTAVEQTADVQQGSDSEVQANSPTLGPAGGSSQSADPTDYTVARNGTIRVAPDESLGYYAEWLEVSAWDLRRRNHLRFHQPVRIGQRIRLDFRHVSRQDFEKQRFAYHRALQASYFVGHHIEGTEVYVTRRGDSLWTLTRHFPLLPAWLLRQYNPDVNFFAILHPGTRLVIPRIRMVAGSD